jgi:hypothetical protein
VSVCGVVLKGFPCGGVEVERLCFLNEWMDHPGPPYGLPVCAECLKGYERDQLAVGRSL